MNRFAKTAYLVAALLALALVLRLVGIARESFWIDEAYSVRFSSGGIASILSQNAQDAHPPLYYLGLAAWRAVAGDSDARVRVYSVVWSLLGLGALFLLTRDLAGQRAAVIALGLGVVNPLDIYYAQEARMYAQAATLLTFAAWCLWRWMDLIRKPDSRAAWPWVIAYAMLAYAALMTHYLAAVFLIAQGLFAVAWFVRRRAWRNITHLAWAGVAVAFLFLPWVLYVRQYRTSLYLPALAWMPPPRWTDFVSYLGREFFWSILPQLHDRAWPFTIVVPAILLVLAARQMLRASEAGRVGDPLNSAMGRAAHFDEMAGCQPGPLYGFALLFAPVMLAMICEGTYHRVYFRPRFSVLILPAFLALAGMGLDSIRTAPRRLLATAIVAILMVSGALMQYVAPQKAEFRDFGRLWREQGAPTAAVFFPPMIDATASHYIGRVIHSTPRMEIEKIIRSRSPAEIWVCTQGGYNVANNGEDLACRDWLLGIDGQRQMLRLRNLELMAIRLSPPPTSSSAALRFDRWMGPNNLPNLITGFEDPRYFHALEFDQNGAPFHWSLPRARLRLADCDGFTTLVLCYELPPPVGNPAVRPDLKIYVRRARESDALFTGKPDAAVPEFRTGLIETAIRVPAGTGPVWVGWTLNGLDSKRVPGSKDTRVFGLMVRGIGLKR
jgi:4-amino-4-deoxy-L-arabinose transferase-like glycosyltransferase